MTRRSRAGLCPRIWQAEALRDARLSGLDRTTFEEHASTCADCKRELLLLDKLESDVAGVGVAPNAFTFARVRAEILRRASVQPPRTVGLRRRAVAALVVAAAVALGLYVAAARQRPLAQPRRGDTAALSPPKFETWPAPGATLTTTIVGSTAKVGLTGGSCAFSVAPLRSGQRFVVALPDGDIETSGARFTADVSANITDSIRVDEGELVLRRDVETIHLVAGGTWTRLDEPPRAPAAKAVPRAPAAAASLDSGAVAAASPAPPGGALAPVSPANRFDDAVAAFQRGDYEAADASFERFGRDHGNDTRAEDAAYLRAVARSRLGDHARARELARAYLERYPNGLRRVEASRLAAWSPPSGHEP